MIKSSRRRARRLFSFLAASENTVRSAYRRFRNEKEHSAGASEWLQDNYYIVQRAIRQIREDLPYKFYRQLPLLESSELPDATRVFNICTQIMNDSELDVSRMIRFLKSYQKTVPLTIGEIWAVPSMLRFCNLLNLAESLNNVLESGESEDTVSICILNFSLLDQIDWKYFFESTSLVEKELKRDPQGIYSKMDFATRNSYRNVIEKLSRSTGMPETEIAAHAIDLANRDSGKHVGYFLMTRPGIQLLQSSSKGSLSCLFTSPGLRLTLYLGGILSITVLVSLLFSGYVSTHGSGITEALFVFLLGILPASAIAVDLVNEIILHSTGPHRLPGMDFSRGIPSNCRTIVVIPTILSSSEEIISLVRQLEGHYLGNRDRNLEFALLSDFKDAPREQMPRDADLLRRARHEINTLNRRYRRSSGKAFHLFHRKRVWNSAQGCWMGWERKRGKLMEFNGLLLGREESTFITLNKLRNIRYVITLDSDTILPAGAAVRMVSALAHPLNAFGKERGYTVLQPRVVTASARADLSLFSRIYPGDFTVDLYSNAVSDVYQDLFSEGSYVGKGIYDPEAFQKCLEGKVPENALLSHDLFEGIHGRAGLLSDLVLYEDYPPSYLAWAYRLHRWVRGDWQLLPWLGIRVPDATGKRIKNDLSLLSRWKILDNMRRSLVEPSLLALMVTGWILLPDSAVSWTGFVLLIMFRNAIINTVMKSLLWSRRTIFHHWSRAVLGVAFLPFEAFLKLHAIAVTVFRLTVSRKNLLQWISAASTSRKLGSGAKRSFTWKKMSFVVFFTAILLSAFIVTGCPWIAAVSPLLTLWLLSPEIVLYINRPPKTAKPELNSEENSRLRMLAVRTWSFFDTFVGPEGHWLPPDHFQEDPLARVACRTSPTNTGLYLLSVLAAGDMGYLGLSEFILKISFTLSGMKELERHRGHILNWYDTRTLQPLLPRYVSTVDSGNLAGCLLVLARGCRELENAAPICRERWQGFLDTVLVLRELIHEENMNASELISSLDSAVGRVKKGMDEPETWLELLVDLCSTQQNEIDQLLMNTMQNNKNTISAHAITQLRLWSERVRMHLSAMLRETEEFCPWMFKMCSPPELLVSSGASDAVGACWKELQRSLPQWPSPGEVVTAAGKSGLKLSQLITLLKDQPPSDNQADALKWCDEIGELIGESLGNAKEIVSELRRLHSSITEEFNSMGFGFLYSQKRKVFHLGYNVESEHLDDNYYDLLASEARLSSLIAIAKGDVPVEHWLHLSRPLTVVSGIMGLLSWSGTMFEYLMPLIFTGFRKDTLLGQSCTAAVKHQIKNGISSKTPWGVSESCYYRFDPGNQYQYKAFGVPGLGFKRGLEDDHVIAPYASLLALSISPAKVMLNADILKKLGMTGSYGFYESMDYTQARLPAGKEYAVVKSYMTHHQGMILLSVVNFLQKEVMANRFLSEPLIRVVELLLQEQMPLKPPIVYSRPEPLRFAGGTGPGVELLPWSISGDYPVPRIHFLSNGSYSVMLTDSGGGFSQWKGISLTEWKEDVTLDSMGTWIYLKDIGTGYVWSASRQPAGSRIIDDSIHFLPHKVGFISRDNGITTDMEVIVDSEEDAEIRRIHLMNNTESVKTLFVCSYSQVVMSPEGGNLRHPAFNKLFIVSEFLEEQQVLMFSRRKRDPGENDVCFAQMIVGAETLTYEADRLQFLGRGGAIGKPASLFGEKPTLTKSSGEILDPVMCMGTEIELLPQSSTEFFFITFCAPDATGIQHLAEKFRTPGRLESVFSMGEAVSRRELSTGGITCGDLERMQPIISALIYPSAALRASPELLETNTMGQRELWRFGISGDYPMLLVSIDSKCETDLLTDVLNIHSFWRNRGLLIDLVILNTEESGYDTEIQGKISRLLVITGGEKWLNCRGGVFLVRMDQITRSELVLIKTWARVSLDCAAPLEMQLQAVPMRPVRLPEFVPILADSHEHAELLYKPDDLLFPNGTGGFSPDGSEYVIYLDEHESTPAPWINVISNPVLGFIASETGLGCSWAINSSENRLSPWNNDAVTANPGEVVYIRDEETGVFWSPSPLPIREKEPYLVRHGAGYTSWEHNSHGLVQKMVACVSPDLPLKTVAVHLKNSGKRNRRISITYYLEPVLGTHRSATEQFIVSKFHPAGNALIAWNTTNRKPPGGVLFLASSRIPNGLTTDRTEFLGRNGSLERPAALHRTGLSGTIRTGLDPCLAMQVIIWIGPSEEKEVTFLAGQGTSTEDALALIDKSIPMIQNGGCLQSIRAKWDEILGCVQVTTPDSAMNIMLNRWLLYQTLSCRIWGRTALYQSSGAFGFRDQLQDCMALCNSVPDEFRQHILRSASKQFEEGDVLHWWHPPHPVGVRTRCSDDLLWLPYATALYIERTGDVSILSENVPFLEGSVLEPGELERYSEFRPSSNEASLHEHCLRALRKGNTTGRHGFPLIGTHDWNDGMNKVGVLGAGESIWLGWFLYDTLQKYSAVCRILSDEENAADCTAAANSYKDALNRYAWDGKWYLRAFYDNGTPLGSSENTECRIDSLAQSWAVLSGAGDPERNAQAMNSALENLADYSSGIVKLLDPPFDKTLTNPGYIMGYPPGIRENGGQYTHAAAWVAWAFASQGMGDTAEALFRMLNPINHSDSPGKRDIYRIEPYVVAGDVYSSPHCRGRGGWSWYTGASSWLYRLGIEAILGITTVGNTLHVNPCIPAGWEEFSTVFKKGASSYRINISNPDKVSNGVVSSTCDGILLPSSGIPLTDDGKDHEVSIVMGRNTQ